MWVVPQCLGPEELALARRLALILPWNAGFADLNMAPGIDAFRLLEICSHHLTGYRKVPYVPGLTRAHEGEGRPAHIDRYPSSDPDIEHWRIVALVNAARAGGELLIEGVAVELQEGDAVCFRADACLHEVTRVRSGVRLALISGYGLRAPSR